MNQAIRIPATAIMVLTLAAGASAYGSKASDDVPLHKAAVAGKTSASEKAKLEAELLQAAQQDDSSRVLQLLQKHVSPDATSGDGTTALHWAAYNDDVTLVKALLKAGAKVEPRTRLRALTPLHMAAESGDATLLGALIQGGAQVDARNESGTTALMIASASGSTQAVETLLAHGADVNAREKTYGETALFFAASRNRAEVVRLLLVKGANPKVKTTITKLERVTLGVNGEVLDGKKPSPNAEKAGGGKAEASTNSKPAGDTKEEADGKAPAKPDDKTKDAYGFTAADRKKRVYGTQQIGGMTALLTAARDGQKDAVAALLDAHDDVNQVSDTDHATPLILTLINGHYDLASFLLDRGADPQLATTDGVAPLYALIDVQWAPHTWYPQPVISNEHIGYLDLASKLLEHGADPNAKIGKKLWFRVFANDETWFDVEGATPFLRAAVASDLAAMKLLVAHGADPNVATVSADTPLMAAAGIGWAAYWTSNAPYARLDVVKFCLDHGAQLNAKDAKGYTALHGAAFRGDNEMVKYLIAQGADVHAKTKDGDSVADVANGLFEHAMVHLDTVALLEQSGSSNAHNCRSNECVVPAKEDKPAAANAGKKPEVPVKDGEQKPSPTHAAPTEKVVSSISPTESKQK
jgi:ankyrin repeat protein